MSSIVRCPSEDSLKLFQAGQSLPDLTEQILSHLDDCESCREQLNAMRSGQNSTGFTETILPGDTTGESESGIGHATASFDAGANDLPNAFGRYRVIRELGQGGMGSVYAAMDEVVDRTVAVKVPRLDGPEERIDERRARFQREARAAATVRHPNLCPIYDCGIEDDQPWLVMAYIPGRTLADILKEGRFENQRDALLMMKRVAAGVAAIHKAGLVHRDLKPANILLEQDAELSDPQRWTPCVTDFGLARQLADDIAEKTANGAIVGTPAYMSPEQAAGDRDAVGPQTDIWALGVIFYEMLSGERPFEAPTTLAVLARIRQAELPSLESLREDIPAACISVIQRCLQKSPRDRFSTAADLEDEIDNLLTGTASLNSTVELPSSAESPVERPAKREMRRAVIVAGCLIGLTTGLLAIFRPWDGASNEDDISPGPSQPKSQVGKNAKKPLQGNLDLLIFESAREGDNFQASSRRQGLRLHDPDALPLTTRDWVRIEAELNRPAYVYIVWIDTEGVATPIFPWRHADWKQPQDKESPRRKIQIPNAESVSPLTVTAPGIETVLLLARDEPLEPADYAKLAALFPKQPRNSKISRQPRFAVWLENGTRPQEKTRGAIRPNIVAGVDDPELQIRAAMKRVRHLFPYSRAVMFGNTGKK